MTEEISIYDKVANLTEADVDALIDLATYYNYSGFTSDMLNDSFEEKVGYLLELDEKNLKKLYNEYMEN